MKNKQLLMIDIIIVLLILLSGYSMYAKNTLTLIIGMFNVFVLFFIRIGVK